MRTGAHHRQLDLILDILDVNGTTLWLAPHQRRHHLLGEHGDLLAHPRRRCALSAIDGDERFGHSDRDLGRLKGDHRAIAADHLVIVVTGVAGQIAGRQQGSLAMIAG